MVFPIGASTPPVDRPCSRVTPSNMVDPACRESNYKNTALCTHPRCCCLSTYAAPKLLPVGIPLLPRKPAIEVVPPSTDADGPSASVGPATRAHDYARANTKLCGQWAGLLSHPRLADAIWQSERYLLSIRTAAQPSLQQRLHNSKPRQYTDVCLLGAVYRLDAT